MLFSRLLCDIQNKLFINELAAMLDMRSQNQTSLGGVSCLSDRVPQVSPRCSLPPPSFCLVLPGGSNDQKEGQNKKNHLLWQEPLQGSKSWLCLGCQNQSCSGRLISMVPWEAQGHPGRLAPGATGPASCSGGQPVKTKSPHFLTHSQTLILIQLWANILFIEQPNSDRHCR